MKKVIIYPGRFQPMLPHHAEVYTRLQAQFPGSEVYVATSNKVEGSKSPFNFEEKKSIITEMHGIPEDRIILAANPYLIDSYMKEFDQKNTMVIFAVGGKDEDRFPMRNIDDSTGLNMAVRGERRPTYYQMINTLKQHPALPMSDRGYIHITPTVAGMGEVASASAFRNAFTSVEDTEKRKEVFQKYMGTYNETMFTLFNNKLIGEKMSEQLDIMKFLAGLLNEAPINFDADPRMPDEDEADEYADKPGYTQDNMINQLGKIIDSDDAGKEIDQMKIKKFTPVTKVTTDDNGSVDVSPAEAKALKSMMDMLSSARMGEEQSPREKFLDAIQTKKGLLNMIDFAYDKKVVQKSESFVAPDMNLDDIRESYDITDKRDACHSKTHDCATKVIHPTWGEGKPMYESHAVPTDEGYVAWYDVEFEHGIEKEVPAQDMKIITLAEHGVNASKKSKGLKNVLMAGKLKDVIIDAMSMDQAEFDAEYNGSFDWEEINREYNEEHPDFQEQPGPMESAPEGEGSQQEHMYNKLITAYENGEEDLAEVLGLSMQELDQEMTEFAMERGLHMDDDRDDVVTGYIEQAVDNADYKDHGEYEGLGELNDLRKRAGLEVKAVEEGYTYDMKGADLVVTSPEGKTKVIKDFTYFDETPSQAELKSFFDKGISQRDDFDEGEEGDLEEAVEEGKLPAGLQAYQDKKNGKKADADKDEDKDQDKDEDKEEVDEALNDMAQEHIDALAVLKRMAGLS